jgi:hypothetical protein
MISGSKRESVQQKDFTKKVGLFEAKVLTVNPDAEEYKDKLGIELKEDSKALEYLGKSEDGNAKLRMDVWLEDVKTAEKFKVSFFLEDKEKENKDGTKKQYINNVGVCSWADDPNNLPDWFAKREYRVANVGEEELYTFLRTWLGNLDYRMDETTLQLEWKKLMKGNVKDIRDQIDGEFCTNVVALATVKSVTVDGDIKEYQGIYNKSFLPAYTLKQFRLIDYSDTKVLAGLRTKKNKDLKPHERFVIGVTGEYGCKDYYILKDLKDYDNSDNFAASDKTMSTDGADF